MVNLFQIKKIGFVQAFKAISVGLIIAYVIFGSLAGPFWIFTFEYTPTILFATVIIYIAGYFLGSLVGKWIFMHKKFAILFGVIGGFLIVWTATFLGSIIGFVNEGLQSSASIANSISDYIFNPLATVTLFGFFPIIIVSIWYGLSVKNKIGKIRL